MSPMMIPFPFAGFADPLSSWSHLLAAVASLVGAVFLWRKGRGNTARLVSLIIFSIALVFLFSMSGVFHMLPRGGSARDVLQRLDHAGIWTLIAATFTPIHVILFRSHWRWAILLGVWTTAITGLVFEVVFFTDFPESVLLTMFLGLGWVGGISGRAFKKIYGDHSVWLIAGGGICYSVGALIDFIRWPILVDNVLGPHEIFHLFIIAGAAMHWMFIYHWCDHPVTNTLTFEVSILPTYVYAKSIGEAIEVTALTLDEAKTHIEIAARKRYHSSITPSIRLRYFNEEQLR